ncbi:hypothetical protein D3C72_914580 [compost metagenome]
MGDAVGQLDRHLVAVVGHQVAVEGHAVDVGQLAAGVLDRVVAARPVDARHLVFEGGHAQDHAVGGVAPAPARREARLGGDGQALDQEDRLEHVGEVAAAEDPVDPGREPLGLLEVQDVGVLVQEQVSEPGVVAPGRAVLARARQVDEDLVVGQREAEAVDGVFVVEQRELGAVDRHHLHEGAEDLVGLLGVARGVLGDLVVALGVVHPEVRRDDGLPLHVRIEHVGGGSRRRKQGPGRPGEGEGGEGGSEAAMDQTGAFHPAIIPGWATRRKKGAAADAAAPVITGS